MTKRIDVLDSRVLADLLRMNWLPQARMPSPEEDNLGTLSQRRLMLGKKILSSISRYTPSSMDRE